MELLAIVVVVAIFAIVTLGKRHHETEPWTEECTSCVSGACNTCEAIDDDGTR